MTFYHYTASRHLRPIAQHGLTIGDVPTDLRRDKGRVGVWLTTSPENTGHGLAVQGPEQKRYRLTLDLEPNAQVVRWSDWAPRNSTIETINNLKICAGRDGASQWRTWFLCFGIIPPSAIAVCHDMHTGEEVPDWQDAFPVRDDFPGIAMHRRAEWHWQVLRDFKAAKRRDEANGHVFAY
ncbi:hypothetical protein [Methylobacterium sp. 88A]|uniref:hypothetical protein n=1 Tax=Methylobacterium sp. 88A TaxID=1131813 RepID=UPI000360A992|nr:hypothetical protein [Methylobacterium sp. 88A]